MSDDKIEIPINPVELVLARKSGNMSNPSVEVDSTGKLVPRGRGRERGQEGSDNNKDGYTVSVRKSKNDGDRPEKAKSLKACKGLKGCEFATCAKEVFGKLPRNLAHLEEHCSNTTDNK